MINDYGAGLDDEDDESELLDDELELDEDEDEPSPLSHATNTATIISNARISASNFFNLPYLQFFIYDIILTQNRTIVNTFIYYFLYIFTFLRV